MFTSKIIILVAVVAYLPLAGSLLYVWWKYGKGEKGVATARTTFLIGSVVLFAYMVFI